MTPPPPASFPGLRESRRIIVLRTDAIGDNVLNTALLKPLRAACPEADIFYACQEPVAELLKPCPLISGFVPFNRGRSYADETYRRNIGARLGEVGADIILNPMLTREPLVDALAAESGAARRVGFGGTAAAGCRDDAYTHLIAPEAGRVMELRRVEEFLRGVGVKMEGEPAPQLWLEAADQAFAQYMMQRVGFDPQKTIIVYAGAGAISRVNRRLGEALAAAFPAGDFDVISVGSAPEFPLHEEVLRTYPGRHLNLCGRVTLRQTAALIERARLTLGAETGGAHLACVMGTPHVVIVGGGHFGRFMPWPGKMGALTTMVSLPLGCFGCDWKCRYERAHCIADIEPETIAAGLRAVVATDSDKPRIVVQKMGAPGNAQTVTPPTVDVRQYLEEEAVEILRVDGASAAARGSTPLLRGVPARFEQPLFRVTAIVDEALLTAPAGQSLREMTDQTLFARGELEIMITGRTAEEDAEIVAAQQRYGEQRIRRESRLEEGRYAMWNRSAATARGQYLTVARGRLHPETLEILADMLDARPDCALAYADSDVMARPEFDRPRLFEGNYVGRHAAWRRSVHREVGYFDNALREAADYEFWLRLAVRWPFAHVPRVLTLGEPVETSDVDLLAYEERLVQARYWDAAWGEAPAVRAVIQAFADLGRRIKEQCRGKRVAVFGAGQHTRRHIARFRKVAEPWAELVAILDDRVSDRAVGGIPVFAGHQWREKGVQALVVSSDTYEAAMVERAREVTGGFVPVLSVYRPELAYMPAASGVMTPL